MSIPSILQWHEAPELPPWEGEEIAVLTYCNATATFEVAQFNWEPDASFLIGVDRWAMLWPTTNDEIRAGREILRLVNIQEAARNVVESGSRIRSDPASHELFLAELKVALRPTQPNDSL